MLDTIRLVIAWTCVAVFIASAIITILALLRVLRLPNKRYLNRLFAIIIVAVVGTCASFFQEFIHSGAGTTDKKAKAGAIDKKAAPETSWIGFKHSGAYVAKFYLNWTEDGQPKSWSSGSKTAGYSEVIFLKANAREIKISAQAATGLVWDPWGTIFKLALTNGPPNKVYVAQGTTLHRKWGTADR